MSVSRSLVWDYSVSILPNPHHALSLGWFAPVLIKPPKLELEDGILIEKTGSRPKGSRAFVMCSSRSDNIKLTHHGSVPYWRAKIS